MSVCCFWRRDEYQESQEQTPNTLDSKPIIAGFITEVIRKGARHRNTGIKKKSFRKKNKNNAVEKIGFAYLDNNIWFVIAESLAGHPHSAICLCACNRYFRELFAVNVWWWGNFYSKVLDYQRRYFKQSKYLKKLQHIERIVHEVPNISSSAISRDSLGNILPKNTLALIFGSQCQFCGKQSHHFIVKSLLVRTCHQCFCDNLVSNGELFFRYGLSFYDFMETYAEHNGILVPTACVLESRMNKKGRKPYVHSSSMKDQVRSMLVMDDSAAKRIMSKLQTAASDLDAPFISKYAESENRECCFLWKSDIERIMDVSLKECQQTQLLRIQAARLLTAACARLAHKLTMQKNAFMMVPLSADGVQEETLVRRMCWLNQMKSFFRIPLPRTWVPGGPFFSYFDVDSSPRRLTDFWWRPGFDMGRFDFINQVILRRYKHRLLLRLKK